MDNNNLYVRKNMHHTTVTLLVTSLVTVLVIFISIGYSAINASLMVTGDLEYKAQVLYDLIAKSSKGLDTNIDFGVNSTAATSGVYKLNSTNSAQYPVYYYRGIVSNNNVKFANLCWKMVRTTSTGGVKLIYNGVPDSNGSCNNTGEATQIGKSEFNSITFGGGVDKLKYVGYTYDTNTDSTIKTYIDDWYSKNMLSYTGMLEDTEWCNDRSVSSTNGYYYITYAAYARNYDSLKPSIVCPNTSDKYTVSSSKGNGLLKYPVALLTADEVMLAGHGYKGTTDGGYLITGETWWLLSPCYSDEGGPLVYGMNYIRSTMDYVLSRNGIRPAISLKSGTKVSSGDGSYSNPYQVIGG